MGKLWTVIRREYLERVRSKWFVIVTLFGPLFFGTVMVLPGYLSVRAMREARVANIRIIDATGAGLGARVARRLAPTPLQGEAQAMAAVDTVAPTDVAAAEAALLDEIQARTLVGVLTVDAATLEAGTARYMGAGHRGGGEAGAHRVGDGGGRDHHRTGGRAAAPAGARER